MKVFYFTGTGNSLYVAKRIGGELISIPQALKNNELTFEDEQIGIVCPCYGLTIPYIVREFIEKSTLKTPYLFLIVTYGNEASNATGWTNHYAQKFGKKFQYANTLLMIDNYLPVFDLTEQYKKEKHTEENLSVILEDIYSGKTGLHEGNVGHKIMSSLFDAGMGLHLINKPTEFSVNDDCVGCGVCTKVCPRGNIHLQDKKPIFENQCEFCLACVNNCPKKAIKIKRDKNSNERYRNEHVTVQEIIKANNQ